MKLANHDRYTSKNPWVEFRCQFPAARTEFRCPTALANCTQYIDLQYIFAVEEGLFGGRVGCYPCCQGDAPESGHAPVCGTALAGQVAGSVRCSLTGKDRGLTRPSPPPYVPMEPVRGC